MIGSHTASSEMVEHAYRLLKQDVYYDKMDLFLRANIAEYEASGKFTQRQDALAGVVDELRQASPSPKAKAEIQKWLQEVDFRLLPKSVEFPRAPHKQSDLAAQSPRLISNVRTAERYIIKQDGGVQYLIYAPVELYILSTLWCLLVGVELDRKLGDGCLGNRMETDSEGQATPRRLFKIFHYQYKKWRDTAIERAEALLDQGTSSILVSLDIKQCYYHLSVDWQNLTVPQIPSCFNLAKNLTGLLRHIHRRYHEKTSPFLLNTHASDGRVGEGLPIGLPSSRVLANFLLAPFDAEVREKLRPDYYGRYVDDMLIVAQAPPDSVVRGGGVAILHDLLIKRHLLNPSKDGSVYKLTCLPALTIQSNKLIVQHFDKEHSRAGLREFVEQIKREASDFRFLPADERGRELDACAYDIIYEGSINKLRSVIGVRENSTELSKYLARRMVEHRLTSEALRQDIAKQLDRFTRGKNILDFCTTWERILTLLIVKGKDVKAAEMAKRCLDTIERLVSAEQEDADWVLRARADLKRYLELALAMPFALLAQSAKDKPQSKRLVRLIKTHFTDVYTIAGHFRRGNLMRHQWVAWPLLNYTSYEGSLIEINRDVLESLKDWSIKDAEGRSPRHIHEDERQLFNLLRLMASPEGPNASFFFGDKAPAMAADSGRKPGDPYVFKKLIPDDSAEKLAIGIANLHVSERDIAASYDPLREPNTSWDRQAKLFNLLNLAERERCDMLVLPEVSVPYSWLPFMVAHARQTEMALVFGLEHWVSGQTAYNLLVTILPFKDHDRYRACRLFIRPKNHYAPVELRELDRLDLHTPSIIPGYFLFEWRNTRFTVFNCFELSNIRHRSAFRGEIDFLVSVEWNRDTPYFSSIVESAVRDLHCFVVQVNTSQFGDSRVTSPKKSEEMNAARVSGGLNTTLLKAEIDIRDLNDFRSKKASPVDKRYKPTPAGFEHDAVRKRATRYGSGSRRS